jgi:hypothetical protein
MDAARSATGCGMTLATQFLTLSPERRALAFEQAAAQSAMPPMIVEKDFWVSWLLGQLFAAPSLAPHVVFKGGTSLSKVFGVIDRFSEDIDLSLAPEFVGADTAAFNAQGSRTQRDAAMKEMQRLCAETVRERVQPTLEAALSSALGPAETGGWLRFELDADAQSPILYFRYPATQNAGFDYLRREVKLELGALTDQQPTGRHAVRPLLADAFPTLFADWSCEVTALSLERTFWEKATILHAEFYRPPLSATPDRYARHYFDMAKLLGHSEAPQFLADRAQCQHVVEWKRCYFPRAWANYDLAQHGSFRLMPLPERQGALERDYTTMQPMFMTTPPPFATLMAKLSEAEAVLNG